jgi:hypothetical protein
MAARDCARGRLMTESPWCSSAKRGPGDCGWSTNRDDARGRSVSARCVAVPQSPAARGSMSGAAELGSRRRANHVWSSSK